MHGESSKGLHWLIFNRQRDHNKADPKKKDKGYGSGVNGVSVIQIMKRHPEVKHYFKYKWSVEALKGKDHIMLVRNVRTKSSVTISLSNQRELKKETKGLLERCPEITDLSIMPASRTTLRKGLNAKDELIGEGDEKKEPST